MQYDYNNDLELEDLISKVSNWTKWGKEDQLGTINYITAEKISEASKLVKSGVSISLARKSKIPRIKEINNREIRKYKLRREDNLSVDYIGVAYHGDELTHLDALCHVNTLDNKLFNGYSGNDITDNGSKILGIENLAQKGIISRGVLLDISKLKGRALKSGEPIFPVDLDETIKKFSIDIKKGDTLFIRTGRGRENVFGKFSGLHPQCLLWLHKKKISLLGSDGGNDFTSENYKKYHLPIHKIAIPYMGMPLLDNADLDELSDFCEKEKRWDFMIVIAPWNFSEATGSPVNPIAIF